MVDGAAFEHEIEFPRLGARELGDVVADGLIVGEVELAAPAIELESERECASVGSARRSGPVSRSQMSPYRARTSSAASPSSSRAEASASAPFTSSLTRLVGASARTSAATSRRGAARSPFHSSESAGHAVQIAFCGAHSGGTEIDVSVTAALMTPYL